MFSTKSTWITEMNTVIRQQGTRKLRTPQTALSCNNVYHAPHFIAWKLPATHNLLQL